MKASDITSVTGEEHRHVCMQIQLITGGDLQGGVFYHLIFQISNLIEMIGHISLTI